MAEYIEREALKNDIAKSTEPFNTGSVFRAINRQIAADVAPVAHGRWDDIPNEYMSVVSKTGAYHGNATTCSVCHEVNPNAFKTNYCPNCGAKMDGGGSDDKR